MYLDTLIRIKNGLARGHERVKIPYSKNDLIIIESLVKEGYLESVVRKGRGTRRIIEVKLKYKEGGEPAISGIKFMSRPSRRLYAGYRDIKKSHQGFGHYLLSTPKGVLTDAQAKKEKVGGQLLFEVW